MGRQPRWIQDPKTKQFRGSVGGAGVDAPTPQPMWGADFHGCDSPIPDGAAGAPMNFAMTGNISLVQKVHVRRAQFLTLCLSGRDAGLASRAARAGRLVAAGEPETARGALRQLRADATVELAELDGQEDPDMLDQPEGTDLKARMRIGEHNRLAAGVKGLRKLRRQALQETRAGVDEAASLLADGQPQAGAARLARLAGLLRAHEGKLLELGLAAQTKRGPVAHRPLV